MNKFINREDDLRALEKQWRKKSAQFFIIYGKRRVGKTELIKQFIKNKPSVYFYAEKSTSLDLLLRFSRAIGAFFHDTILKERGVERWDALFEYLRNKNEKIVIALDEFPSLIDVDKAIPSIFQRGWDEYLKDSKIFFILCGSSISIMESDVLSYQSPLYGRRTGQLLMHPFGFYDAWEFFPSLDFGEFLKVYSVVGGMPYYLCEFQESKNLMDALKDKILNPRGLLYHEVEFLLREEFREARTYFIILKAIANHRSKFGEISSEAGLQKNILMKYLHVLEDLHVIKKEIPVTEEKPLKSKKGLYKIQDKFVQFWFRYVLPYKSALEIGDAKEVLSVFHQTFDSVLARAYEEIAADILRKNEAQAGSFERMGRWWDKNEEIDLVGVSSNRNEIIFGEVKWTNKNVGMNIYEALKEKARKVQWGHENRKEKYVLFSRSGFTEDLIKTAKKERVLLVQGDKIRNNRT